MSDQAVYKLKQCPVCGNQRPEIMRWVEKVGEVQRILCKACDTIYFDRQPPIRPTYDIKYNKHFFRSGDIRKAGIMAAKLAELALAKWNRPNILEAGSGNGLTVGLLRAMNLNAFGIDLDPNLAVYLMEKFKIPIATANFLEFNPPGKYHLIYSSHVIEHCEDPLAFFIRAYKLLEPGGIFYLDTPDTYYWDRMPNTWHHFKTRQIYEHCCLLGHTGIEILARTAGLKIAKIERYGDFMSQQAIMLRPKGDR